MEELTSIKLDAESHLLLEQPLLRLPLELTRINIKRAQRSFDTTAKWVSTKLKEAAQASQAGRDPSASLAALDNLIDKMQGIKIILERFRAEEESYHKQMERRIEHLAELFRIPSLADVKYDAWSRVRLNRLLVDYLLRMGYAESARALAREKGIEDLVDLQTFEKALKVERSLRNHSTEEALKWCNEYKTVKKQSGLFEFKLRFQQYVELLRERKLVEARKHAVKYLAPQVETFPKEVNQAAGLLAYGPETQAPAYQKIYSQKVWDDLVNLFIRTHHELFSLPTRPLLEIALSAGMSALKTPSCHSKHASSSANSRSSTTSVCPICSKELNELARDLPYAHHSKSWVEDDPVVLPNGRMYGRNRLMLTSAKAHVPLGQVKDPTTEQVFVESSIRKIFIS